MDQVAYHGGDLVAAGERLGYHVALHVPGRFEHGDAYGISSLD
jgi:hypothetical protein